MDNENIYDDQICEACGNEVNGDEADTYGGLCKHCYDNYDEDLLNNTNIKCTTECDLLCTKNSRSIGINFPGKGEHFSDYSQGCADYNSVIINTVDNFGQSIKRRR